MPSEEKKSGASEKKSARHAGGRPKKYVGSKKQRAQASSLDYEKRVKRLRVSEQSVNALQEYEAQNNLATHSGAIDHMLNIVRSLEPGGEGNREEPVEPTEPEEDDDMSSLNLSILKMVALTRLVVEGGVAVVKVPMILAFASLFFLGES